MRIASPWLLQTRPYLQTGAALQRHVNTPTSIRIRCLYAARYRLPSRSITHHAAVRAKQHDDRGKTSANSQLNINKTAKVHPAVQDGSPDLLASSPSRPSYSGAIPVLSRQERQNPETWVNLLERYVPPSLQWRNRAGLDSSQQEHHGSKHTEILTILNTARKSSNTGQDILAYMITGERRKAGLWICDYLLKSIASRMPGRSSDELPSNIVWPRRSLYSTTGRGIKVDGVSHVSDQLQEDWNSHLPDPRYSFSMSAENDRTMDQIWSTLGSLVIQAADIVGDEGQQILNAVQLVLGQVHNLDLVPDNVYAYDVQPFSSTVRRTPIIHLVSSRILTALSDATWRDQQQENIERAASHGLSYKEIGRDPPGGRFRLKVRPIDAEVWLEFILWCCVEGGFAGAGARIINQLQQNTEDPWFALTWTDNDGISQIAPRIDWARVKSRTGGTVGRLEGYSNVKPLAEMPPRTISTEVVLALVESHIDSLRRVRDGRGMTLEAAQHGIFRLLSFLEPHDLPLSYFDYISARLLQTEALYMNPSRMTAKWFERLVLLKALKPARQPAPPRISFHYNALLVHSEFTAGLLQQALDGFVQEGNIHDALTAFNDLQKLVDNSKLNAIGSFLQRIYSGGGDFFGSRYFEGNPDFVNSHGQLPMYKLAGLLNLATDTKLIGFGQWLLYNQDPDGPLVPETSYGSSAMARALIRFAALSNDRYLLEKVSTQRDSRRLRTVNYLRTLFNTRLSLLDFEGATKVMEELASAQGGGFGLINVAYLAGTILQLEQHLIIASPENTASFLNYATDLLDRMLAGQFSGRRGALQQTIQATFKQQIAHLLVLFRAYPDSSLAKLAETHRNRYRQGNVPNVPPTVFNTFLEAVLSAKGAGEGAKLVDRFCTSKFELQRVSDNDQSSVQNDDDEDLNETVTDGSPWLDNDDVSIQTFVPFQDHGLTSKRDEIVEINDDNATPGDGAEIEAAPDQGAGNSSDRNLPTSSQFSSPFFEVPEPLQEPLTNTSTTAEPPLIEDDTFVCIYDARTIRLIVRTINKDMQEPGLTKRRQQRVSYDIWGWAARKFAELGYDGEMIKNEIRKPVNDPVDKSLRTRKRRSKVDKPSRERPASRISKAFSGKNVLSNSIG